mgnify:FL=1
MSPSTINTLVTVVFIVLGITFTRSILIMLGGKNIFKKAHKGEKTAYYPIINLFTMLEIVDMSIFWGILFFVPGVNLIVLMIMSYKLGTVFNTSFGFKMGLVFLPICFYPLLFISDKQYKISDEEYFKALDNAKDESINLMTQDEINAENNEIVDEGPIVDSVFKSDLQLMEKPAPYKAAKIDLLGMEKEKAMSKEENIFEPIEVKEPPKPIKEDSEVPVENTSKFTTELDKKKDMEYVDL